MRRILLSCSLLGLMASVGGASSIIYATDVFVPGISSPTLLAGTAPLTASQLIARAGSATSYTTTNGDLSTFVALPQFNDQGGSLLLDSVQIEVGWVAQGTVVARNGNTSTENVSNLESTVPITFILPSFSNPFVVDALAGPYSGNASRAATHVTGENQTNCLKNGGTWTGTQCIKIQERNTSFGGNTSFYGTASSAVLTTGLSSYLGTSNLDMNVSLGRGQYSGDPISGVTYMAGSSSAGAVVEIIYNYHAVGANPVPEPTVAILIGAALTAMGLIHRSRAIGWLRR